MALFESLRTPLADEPPEHPYIVTWNNLKAHVILHLRRVLSPTIRTGIYGVGTIVLLVLVDLPYWLWSKNDPITQVSIPHSSRDNFLVNTSAGLVFWLIPYGLLLLVFPYAIYKGLIG